MKRIIDNGKLPKPELPTSQEAVDKFYSRRFNLSQFLFDKQLVFVEDPSPFKVAVCSRRAGKTVACAAHLIDTALKNSNTVSLYITLSAANAKKLIWKELKNINVNFKLDGIVNESELSITFINGAIIYVSGAKDKSDIEKFRGLPIKLCYIDECQSFREYIEDLIDDIIEPALLDYNGSLCLIGTPGAVPAGYFHECAEVSDVWSKHKWTFFDNIHIALKSKKTHTELLQRVLKRRNISISHPSIQREYFGKWEFDSESLLINYDKDKNHFQELIPTIKYNYIMGIDIGFKDADAISILAYSDNDPVTYLVEELITTKQGITELVEQIQKLDQKYHVNKMVMDFGGLGKKIGEEIIKRYSIPVEAADKTRKMENIELMNDALRNGRLKAKSGSRFAQDSYLVEIDKDKSTPDKIKVSDRFHSDIIDSVLYAFKFSPAYSYVKPKPPPKWGSKEWVDAQDNSMFEAELEGHLKANELSKYENGEF
jgi:Phage terminase large subunit